MAWRVVQQPNGLLAIFSDIVDSFTWCHMTYDECIAECRNHEGMGALESKEKVQRGIDAGNERFEESLTTIMHIHGKREANKYRKLMSKKVEQ